MKTNNIFRTLFMAVLLLMGVCNVMKADVLYSSDTGTSDWTSIPGTKFIGHKGDVLEITYETDAVSGWTPSYAIKIGNHKTVSIQVANVSVAERGICKVTLDDDLYEKIITDDNFFIQPAFLTIYKVEIVGAGGGSDGGGSDEPATPQTYTIKVSPDIANGSITANPTSAKAGETVTLTITPNNGYELDWVSVKEDAENNSVTLNNNNKFTMPASNVTISGGFKAIQTVEAKISSSTRYATFCSKEALDFSGVSGLVAYYAKSVNDGSVILVPVSGTVAARTGLVIKGETTKIPIVTTGTPIEGNLLVGVLSQVVVNEANEYVLTEEGGQAKFVTTEFTGASLNAGHAYLRIPSSSGYSRLAVVFAGETTGIEDRTLVGQEENVYYDLRGVRVAKPTHGIYVVNGKKVFVK